MMRTIMGENANYQFRNQDPLIDLMWYFAKVSGHSLAQLAVQSHLSSGTLRNWFVTKKTRSPSHASVKAFLGSFGVHYGLGASNARRARKKLPRPEPRRRRPHLRVVSRAAA